MTDEDKTLRRREGPAQGAATENRMARRAGGVDNIKTVVQTNGDGSTTTLRTHGGNPEFVTTKPPVPKVEEPYFVFSHPEMKHYGGTDYSGVYFTGMRVYAASKPYRKFRKLKTVIADVVERTVTFGTISGESPAAVDTFGRIISADGKGNWLGYYYPFDPEDVNVPVHSRTLARVTGNRQRKKEDYRHKIPDEDCGIYDDDFHHSQQDIVPSEMYLLGHTRGGGSARDYLLAAYSDGGTMRYKKYRLYSVEKSGGAWTKNLKTVPFASKSYEYRAGAILAPGTVALLFSEYNVLYERDRTDGNGYNFVDEVEPFTGPRQYLGLTLFFTKDFGASWASIDVSGILSERGGMHAQAPTGFTMQAIKENKVLINCTSGYVVSAPTYGVAYGVADIDSMSVVKLASATWSVSGMVWKNYSITALGPNAWLEVFGSRSLATDPAVFGQHYRTPMPQSVTSARYTLNGGSSWTTVTVPNNLMAINTLVPFNGLGTTPPLVAFTVMVSNYVGSSDRLVCESQVRTTSDFTTYKTGSGSVLEVVNGVVFDIIDVGSSRTPAPISSAAPWAHDSKYPAPSEWTAP